MTIVNFVLDRSGSMSSVRRDTIGGFNTYIQTLKRENDVNFSLTLFNDLTTQLYTNAPISQVEELNEMSYQPTGGTALYDAVVETILKLKDQLSAQKDKPSVLFVVMTDGEENSSRTHTHKEYKDLVDKLSKEGWTFVYLGSEESTWEEANSLGVLRGNTGTFQASAQGVRSAFGSLTSNTTAYMAMASGDAGYTTQDFNTLAEDLKKDQD